MTSSSLHANGTPTSLVSQLLYPLQVRNYFQHCSLNGAGNAVVE